MSQTVNDNYPKKDSSGMSDEQIKQLAIQNMQRQEVQNTGFPTEIISLPSKGVLYHESNPLHSGQIEMKYMTAREEDILTSSNLIKQGVVLDKLMQSMIVSPIKFDDLVIGDKNAIMVAARILGYGKSYDVAVECPSCNTENKIEIDLTALPETNVPDDANMIAPGIFEFVLPQSQRVIQFRLLSAGDDRKISKDLESQKRTVRDGIDRELTTRLKHLIVSVDGNADKKFVNNFVDNELFAIDSRALRTYVKTVSPDIKFEIDFTCNECGNGSEALSFNIDTNFFWPKS